MKALAFLPFVVAVFVLFIVLPRRRLRAVEALQTQLSEGDEIMTTGGMFGRISRLERETFDLEIAPGTVVRFAPRSGSAAGSLHRCQRLRPPTKRPTEDLCAVTSGYSSSPWC